jgi:hypothetical protein
MGPTTRFSKTFRRRQTKAELTGSRRPNECAETHQGGDELLACIGDVPSYFTGGIFLSKDLIVTRVSEYGDTQKAVNLRMIILLTSRNPTIA